jgi:hypothetical protein
MGALACTAAALVGACASGPDAADPTREGGPSTLPSSDSAADAMRDAVADGGDAASVDVDADAADTAPWAPPPPAACPTRTFVDEDVVARAAVALGACLADDGFYRTTTYLRDVLGGYSYLGGEATVACLAAVTNGCADVAACVGWSPVDDLLTCNTCQGDTAVICDGTFKTSVACDKFGGTCAAGDCVYPKDPLCATASRCNASGRVLHCDTDRSWLGADCAGLGLACAATPTSGGTKCQGLGSTCTTYPFSSYFDLETNTQATVSSCKGDILPACVNGKMANLDCRCQGPGFTCQTVAVAADGGVLQTSFCGAASECEPRSYKRSCTGSTLVFCNAGKITSIDCTAMGFPGCSTTGGNDQPQGCRPNPGWVFPN